MSERRSRKERKPEDEQDVELNITSIVDCFTVLITYLLVSASFIALGVFDVDIARPPGPNSALQPPQVSLTILMERNRDLKLRLTGAENGSITVPAKNGFWDFDKMTERLEALQKKWPSLKAALLAAEDTMEYKELIKAIEATRKTIPAITLGEKQS